MGSEFVLYRKYIYIYIFIFCWSFFRILDEDVIQDKHGGNDKKGDRKKSISFYFFFVDKCKSWEIRVHHEYSNIYLALHFWESVFFIKFFI